MVSLDDVLDKVKDIAKDPRKIDVRGKIGVFLTQILPPMYVAIYIIEFQIFNLFLIEEGAQLVARIILKYICPDRNPQKLQANLGKLTMIAGVGLALCKLLEEVEPRSSGAFKSYFMACEHLAEATTYIYQKETGERPFI